MIDAAWRTERLRVSDASAEELPQLEGVLASNSATLLLEGIQKPDPDELRRWLTEGNLPPNGQRERYRLQTIWRMDTNEAVGYLSVYHGHPDSATLYIA